MAIKTIKAKIKVIPPGWMGPLYPKAIIGMLFCVLERDSVDDRSIIIKYRDDTVKPGKGDFAFEINFDEAFVTRKQLLKVIREVRANAIADAVLIMKGKP